MPGEEESRRIKILLGDEPSMWRDGLQALLSSQNDLHVVGEAQDRGPLFPRALKYRPDLVLCDSATGEASVGDIRQLRDRGVPARVIVLSSAMDSSDLSRPLRREIAAIVPRNSPTEVLLTSIRKVDRGEVTMRPVTPDAAPAPVPPSLPQGLLSKRERELVGLVALGFRNREIADKLFISEQTVKNHLHNIFEKTGIKDRLELALFAVHHNLYD